MIPPLERWDPYTHAQVVELMRVVEGRWWFSGGHALELDAGRSWREQADIDIGVCRSDLRALHPLLAEHDLYVASAGAVAPWRGESLDPPRNNLWVLRGEAWGLDISIGAGDARRWVFRRDPTLALPWAEALRIGDDGSAYLAPALQLLFKSKEVRPKDRLDAEEILPTLTAAELALLGERLPADHEWHSLISAGGP